MSEHSTFITEVTERFLQLPLFHLVLPQLNYLPTGHNGDIKVLHNMYRNPYFPTIMPHGRGAG